MFPFVARTIRRRCFVGRAVGATITNNANSQCATICSASSTNNTNANAAALSLLGAVSLAAVATIKSRNNNDTGVCTNCEGLQRFETQVPQQPFVLKQVYDILRVLGEGGYGMVYQARRKSDGRIVALKTMPRRLVGKTEFEREVAALQLLSSDKKKDDEKNDDCCPHIVQLVDLHRDNHHYYLAMELIEGGELLDHLIQSGPFSEGLAASFLRQFAEALVYTHHRGLAHADLKPENLMLSSSDMHQATLKVVDFGCATQHDQTREDMLLPAQEFAMGCSFLHRVALGNQFEMERLLQTKPSLVNFRDYDYRTPLHLAASEGHVDICRFLVAKGARINRTDRWGGSPLDDAHRHKHAEVVQFLRQEGGKFGNTSTAVTKLIEAASAGDKEEVEALLEFGTIDMDQGDYDQRTALHLAAGEGRLEMVELLCFKGANVNVQDRWGNRPLDDAKNAPKNSAKIIQLLQLNGAKSSTQSTTTSPTEKPSTKDENEETPLGSSSGTIAYWPPEMFAEGGLPTPATDMWAAGVIMYILLTGSHPLDKHADKSDEEIEEFLRKLGCDKEDHMKLLDEAVFDDRIEGLSDSCIELMRQLMHPDPKKRMTSDNFLRHSWIQGLTASWTAMDKTHSKHLQSRFKRNIFNRFGKVASDKKTLREIFDAIDIAGNGVLDPNEIRIVLRSAGEPEDVISRIVASLDFKRDGGSVQGVSWDAFQRIMSTVPED